MTINPNAQDNGVFSPSHSFDIQSYVPYEELQGSYGFLVDPLNGSTILTKQLPDEVKPSVRSVGASSSSTEEGMSTTGQLTKIK